MAEVTRGQVRHWRARYIDDVKQAARLRAAYIADVVRARALKAAWKAGGAVEDLERYKAQKAATWGDGGSKDRYLDAKAAAAESKRTYKDRKTRFFRRTGKTLGERAYEEAAQLVGITERGGNNRGREVEKIIREGGGVPGQAWCGWFMAYVYKLAGSKAVTWHWGAVRLLWPLAGIRRTRAPRRGDMVRFTFDHVGMFVRDLGNGEIETIEGNTGDSGAVSDSKTGGDGVKRKRRSKALVRDYLRVTK